MDANSYYKGLSEPRKKGVRTNTNSLINSGYSKSDAYLRALTMDKRLFDELNRRYEKWEKQK